MAEHLITPPPELVEQWKNLPEYTDGRRKMIMVTLSRERLLAIAAQAAQYGADQELEACEKYWMTHGISPQGVVAMRYARRPQPPSLKEQALALLDKAEDPSWDINDFSIVRKALEQLDD